MGVISESEEKLRCEWDGKEKCKRVPLTGRELKDIVKKINWQGSWSQRRRSL